MKPDCESMTLSKDDKKMLDFYKNNIKEVVDGRGHRRLQLPLPWKKGYPVSIPESYEVAKRTMNIQTKRLSTQKQQCKKYQATFEKMKDEGHAEVVENKAHRETEQPVH